MKDESEPYLTVKVKPGDNANLNFEKEATVYDVQTIINPAELYDHFVYVNVYTARGEGFVDR